MLRPGEPADSDFLVEMARLACTLAGRPLPSARDEAVLALLPTSHDAAVIACNDADGAIGAAWWHVHDPPLVHDDSGSPMPELAMAVTESARAAGVGTALVDAVCVIASERFDAIALNVHLLNPAVRLYVRTGFRVAGRGRGWYGVAMVKSLR